MPGGRWWNVVWPHRAYDRDPRVPPAPRWPQHRRSTQRSHRQTPPPEGHRPERPPQPGNPPARDRLRRAGR
ncbi:hypothetical protein E3O25_16290 [Cryobacterium sp. TMT1-3]|uniref:Uncharacterized protein n=1 Tax=Cryobacterium luteum TaxID=1424661 RepID=A0A5F0D4G8_9MICO|nr:hypothetical protein E3O10_13055 [Cryobacterium luteum]TFC24825.1 hypothetical protein E3O25_16290 [Cryobacterium sp. TMT1-3]